MRKGFTLIELTIMLGVVAILSGVLFMGLRTSNYRRYVIDASATIQADLRYAQRRAMTEGRRVGLLFEQSNNRYWLIARNAPSGGLILLRNEPTYLQNGVIIHYQNLSGNQVTFTPRGTAYRAATIRLRAGPGNGRYEQNIVINLGAGRVRLEPETPSRLGQR